MKVYRNVTVSGDSLLIVNTETLTGNKVLTVADIVIQWLDPGGSDRDVTFPAEADSSNLMFWIYNDADGEGEDLVCKNDGGTTIATIPPGSTGIFSCDGTNWKRVNDTGISYDAISGDIVIGGGRVTFPGGTNDDGIVFGNLGTANIMIDGQNSGLSGVSDYWLYFDANNYWNAGGVGALKVGVHASFGSDAYGALLTSTGRLRFNVESNNDTLLIEHLYKDVYFNTGDIATWKAPFLIGDGEAIGFWNGDGVSNGTATITDVGGAAHGLSLAAGDLVHIQDCTTSADEGFYRIVSDDGTSVVLDRALTGSDTDLTVIFYKDVIGLFATDGTNGQRIMNYSHQDKPLQIGGDTLAATGHSLGSEDVLIGAKLEVDGEAYFDEAAKFYKSIYLQTDNEWLRFQSDAAFRWSTYNTANALMLLLAVSGNNTQSGNLIISKFDHYNKDHDHPYSSKPTVFIHSNTDPDIRNDEFATLSHDTLRCGADYGAYMQIKSITEEVTIAVAEGNTPPVVTSGNLAPANSLIFGATFRVTDAPGGGATVIDIGRTNGGNLDEFIDGKSCDILGEVGNTLSGDGDGATMPIMNSSADTLTLTTDADVTGDDMKVRITVFYFDMSAPTA